MFSKRCEYGIRAALFIGRNSIAGKRVNLKEVSNALQSPMAFTAKILQTLSKHHLINSVHGAMGGYEIDAHKLKRFTLKDVVDLLDGKEIYTRCGLGLEECNELKPCPLHHQFVAIRKDLLNMLSQTTIYDLIVDLEKGETYLSRLEIKENNEHHN